MGRQSGREEISAAENLILLLPLPLLPSESQLPLLSAALSYISHSPREPPGKRRQYAHQLHSPSRQ